MSSSQKAKGVADIVFLIDATGSMQPCIDALKENINSFINSLTTTDANNSSPVKHWRSKVVGYRDFEVDPIPIIDNPFVETSEQLATQLSKITAEGGGDEPESLLEGIFHVASMPVSAKGEPYNGNSWRPANAAARIVVIFTDASFKEPLEKPKGATIDDVFNKLTSTKIILSIFAPDIPCYEKLSEMDKAEWNVIKGGSTPQESLALFTANKENFKKTLAQLARTISVSAEVISVDQL